MGVNQNGKIKIRILEEIGMYLLEGPIYDR